MVKIWAKIMKNEKIVNNLIYEKSENFDIKHFAIYLMEICQIFDIEVPIVLSKHVRYYYDFNTTKFTADDFISLPNFDSLVLENAVQ